jgi:hypothetical protein
MARKRQVIENLNEYKSIKFFLLFVEIGSTMLENVRDGTI